MNEEEHVSRLFLHLEEVVKSIRGLGEKFDELITIYKILRSLQLMFKAKDSFIEEIKVYGI